MRPAGRCRAGAREAALAIWALLGAPACQGDPLGLDPVHQAAVDALGPESPTVRPGPYHRAGQPCTVCHGSEGPADRRFVLAGTVFALPGDAIGVDRAEVLLVDSAGSSPPPGSVVTNCVGNFFVPADVWQPAFPLRVAVASGTTEQSMIGAIGRQGSCAACHADPRGLASAGHVFVGVSPAPEDPACPASPVLFVVDGGAP